MKESFLNCRKLTDILTFYRTKHSELVLLLAKSNKNLAQSCREELQRGLPAVLETINLPIREKYIVSMAIALSVEPYTAFENFKTLTCHGGEILRDIDPDDWRLNYGVGEKHDRIVELGKMFAKRDSFGEYDYFKVGMRVLAFLDKSPKSGYFTNFPTHIQEWRLGGDKKFEETMKDFSVIKDYYT